MIRIIKASLANVAEIPAMDDWKEMFIDGFKADVVGIIYAIPAILIMHQYNRYIHHILWVWLIVSVSL